MSKIQYLHLSKSWTIFNQDGTIKDFGLRIIKHKQSYAEWNNVINDWNYILVNCNCEICQESKIQPVQLTLSL